MHTPIMRAGSESLRKTAPKRRFHVHLVARPWFRLRLP
jgi:hypothetical protein